MTNDPTDDVLALANRIDNTGAAAIFINKGTAAALRELVDEFGIVRSECGQAVTENANLLERVAMLTKELAAKDTRVADLLASGAGADTAPTQQGTPAARWRANGEADPHQDLCDCERAQLAHGKLTDDELANAVFMCDHRTSFESIGWLTAAKERIRWLSRALTAALAAAAARPPAAPVQQGERPSGLPACPITGKKFWGNIDHPTLGLVATYGGPFDTYTIPSLCDDNELRSERFDQDAGHWIEGGEPIGWFDDEQPAAPVQQITLTGNQLRQALDFINPDGPENEDQCSDDLTFGVRQHRDDDGSVSTGMCCWNDDTDGEVFPLIDEWTAPVQPDQRQAPEGWQDRLYAAMNSEFHRRESSERDGDGQRFGMRIDDTQVGVEFAVSWLEKNMPTAPAPKAQSPRPTIQHAPPVAIGWITTGDVEHTSEGAEIGCWDIEWDHKVIDALPEFGHPETTYGVYLNIAADKAADKAADNSSAKTPACRNQGDSHE